jgi:hypothetical protein
MARWRHRDDSQPPTRRRHRDDSQPTTRRRHRDDSQPTTRRRHREDLRPLTRVHGLSAAADAFFAVSLADSLFFNVSVEAARPRIFLYLVATMAPFAVLAPFIGPFIDRIRGGQRTVLVATCVGRAALTLALSKDLQSLLLFPEAFGVLVLGKAYSVGRSATVPRLVRDEAQLMPANAYMARISLIGSSLGGGIAVVVLTSSSSQLVLYLASILFLAAALAATAVSSPRQPPGQQTRIEYHELHAIRLSRAAQAMGLLRASVGLLTFMIVFALKRAGVPVWMFGVTVAAGGVGAMTSTLISSKLRERFTEERILVMALSLPAGVGLLGALQFAPVTAVLVSAAMGLAAAIGKQSFDAVVQHTAPDANLARAFAGFETRFQLFWISGAALAVLAQPDPRLGLLGLSLILAGAAVTIDVALNASERFEAPPTLVAAVTQLVLEEIPEHDPPMEVLDAAEGLLRRGSRRAALIATAAALEAHRDSLPPDSDPTTRDRVDRKVGEIGRLRDAAVTGTVISAVDVLEAIAAAKELVDPRPRSNDESG